MEEAESGVNLHKGMVERGGIDLNLTEKYQPGLQG